MNKKMLIIIIVAVVVVIAAAAVMFMFFFNSRAPVEKEPVYTNYSPGAAFVTNVKDSKSLFRCSVILVIEGEYDSHQLEEELGPKNGLLRDTIIFTLRELTEEDIRSDSIREELSAKLIQVLSETLEIDNIADIYFDDFIIQ